MAKSNVVPLKVHGFTPAVDVAALLEAKLESSGLTLEDAAKLGITRHSAAETQQISPSFWGLPSMRLPYFDPVTKKPMSPRPGWPAFFRQRALVTVPMPKDFKKYLQPPNSGICAYFPTNIDWKPLLQDPSRTLIITEGELKAAKACKEGFPTIGLGGVNSYKSTRTGIDFLPSLEAVNWVKRSVIIAYDSDFRGNSNVCAALNDLAETLVQRGAIVKMLSLPVGANDEKVGLDDFLLTHPAGVLAQLLASDSIFISYAQPLWSMNDQYVYIPSLERAVRKGTTNLMSVGALRNAVTKTFMDLTLEPNGSISVKRLAAAEKWMGWPLRQDAQQVTYVPGMDPLELVPSSVDYAGPHDADYNTWTGWGCVPVAGDHTPFLKLIDQLFDGTPEEAKSWFLRWCAYPLQYPGKKLFTAAVIYGLGHGTGKSLIGYTLGQIYGKNFAEPSTSQLHGDFNEWAVGKQFVLGDDITGSDKRADLDMLKKMITQKTITVNKKNQPTYVINDCINYFFTSNNPAAFFLEDKDRRFFITEVTADPLPQKFYDGYDKLLWDVDKKFSSAIFHYLKHLDLGDFNPAAAALVTDAKQEMVRSTRSTLGNWVRDLLAAPDDLLFSGEVRLTYDCFTIRELVGIYAAHEGISPESVTSKQMSTELRNAKVVRVYSKMPFRVPGRSSADRFYAVRNPSKWAKASLAQLQSHLTVAPLVGTSVPSPKPVVKKKPLR